MPAVQRVLELSDGSRSPSVKRIHRKVFVRWIPGLYVYKDSASENYQKKKKSIFPGKLDAKSSVPCWLCPAVAEAL